MSDDQAKKIIDEVLKAHWPNWNFSGEELVVWLRELRKFDFDSAREAINKLYISWEKERYPKMAHIMRAIRNHAGEKTNTGGQRKLFGIFRQDGRRRYCDFWGPAKTPVQEIEKRARFICERANEEHGQGHYYQVYSDDTF